MTDKMTPSQRKYCMSRVRSKHTRPEKLLRSALWDLGLRYRLYYKLPGKPDIVFVSARLAIFIDGCFWHGCPLHCRAPSSNLEYWIPKLQKRVERDKLITSELEARGWTVLRFWEHEIIDDIAKCISRIKEKSQLM